MDAYNPADDGYMPSRVREYGEHGWIVTHKDNPTLAIEDGTGWHCVLPDVYDSNWMLQARALLG